MTRSARYDEVADFYEQFAPDRYDDPPMAALLQLIGDVAGLRLLDLACGQGRLSRELARRGAQAVGIDLSAAQLEKAHAREAAQPLQIAYIHADAAAPDALAGARFDGVACSFGLSDIDDLDGVIATVARTLRRGGLFAFSIVHPCFPGWEPKQATSSWRPGAGYYDEGWWRFDGPARSLRAKVGANHRTLSSYLNTFTRHGLILDEIVEPPPPSDWLADPPSVGPVPIYLVARCRRYDIR
jgi:2-polyprenyl-3-methyl-5-hydroxy-6-metoxy-1,4-benzoquinol methylase